MERLPYNPEDEDKKPETTGELDASKKKRKRTRVPLKKAVKKETKEQPGSKSLADVFEDQLQEQKTKKEEKKAEKPLELPEIADESAVVDAEAVEKPELNEEEDYEGELLIDHSDEAVEDPGVDTFEPLFSTEETEKTVEAAAPPAGTIKEAVERLAADLIEEDVTEEEAEPAPPSVAPPLPFIIGTESLPKPEVKPAAAPEESSSRFRGRLSEEWAALRRREADTGPAMVTEEEAQERSFRAKKRGVSSGVVGGGVVGYLVGRRGKRAVEREAKAALENRDKTVERLAKERDSAVEESGERQNVIKRTQAELQELMRRSWDSRVLKRPETTPQVQASRVVEVPAPDRAKPAFEAAPPAAAVKETVRAPAEAKPKPETLPLPEAAPEYRRINEETYKAPEGRRIETSAWHRIEVDEKTGRAVEAPSVAYGEAFKHEQKQEKLAREAAQAQTAAQVGMALLYGGTSPTDTPLTPPGYAYGQKQIARPVSVRQEAAYAARQVASNVGSPLTWAAALAIVVLLFLTGIIR